MIVLPTFGNTASIAYLALGGTGSSSVGQVLRERVGGIQIGDWPHIAWLPPRPWPWLVFTVIRDPFARMGCVYRKMLDHAHVYYPVLHSLAVLDTPQIFARWVTAGAQLPHMPNQRWDEVKRWTIFQTQSALLLTVPGMGAQRGVTLSTLHPLDFAKLPDCLLEIPTVEPEHLKDFPHIHGTGGGQQYGAVLRQDPEMHKLIKTWAAEDFELLEVLRTQEGG